MKTNDKMGWISLIKINPDAEIMRSKDRTRVYKIEGGWLCKFHHFHGASSSMTAQSIDRRDSYSDIAAIAQKDGLEDFALALRFAND